MKTRSIRYGEIGGVEVIDIDVTEPGPDEVQVKGAACGICAWDLSTYKRGTAGGYAAPAGHEGLGYVVKIGANVRGFKEGERIAGGGFAGVCNIKAGDVYKLPESKLADQYWLVEPVSCVVTGLDHCNLKAGDRVAVIGCGFMGLMMLQGLGRSFAEQIIAIDINPARLQLAKQFGATSIINSTDKDLEDRIKELKALKIDTVVDCTGVQAGLDLAAKIVRGGGRINLFGWNRGQATFSGDAWHLGGFTVVNSAPDSQIRDPFPPAIRLLARGIIDLKPLVTHFVPLDEYPQLLAKAVKGEDGYIKGVVKL